MALFWINLPHACYGIEIEDGVCVKAAPIARWMVGKRKEELRDWLRARGAQIERCDDGREDDGADV